MNHTPLLGCNTKWLRDDYKETKKGKKQNDKVEIYYCDTHKIEICRCGHEWGAYEYQDDINIQKLIKAIYK